MIYLQFCIAHERSKPTTCIVQRGKFLKVCCPLLRLMYSFRIMMRAKEISSIRRLKGKGSCLGPTILIRRTSTTHPHALGKSSYNSCIRYLQTKVMTAVWGGEARGNSCKFVPLIALRRTASAPLSVLPSSPFLFCSAPARRVPPSSLPLLIQRLFCSQ